MSVKNNMMETLRHFLDRIKGRDATGPRCPALFCNARGVDSIAEEREVIRKGREGSRAKLVFYCRKCGHIYRIVRP